MKYATECLSSEDGTLHVCRERGEWKLSKQRPSIRWCFKCRKRTRYRLWMFCPIGISYYGPSPCWKCDRCHEENDLFPGWSRTWDE